MDVGENGEFMSLLLAIAPDEDPLDPMVLGESLVAAPGIE
jgi:hypothetical protein